MGWRVERVGSRVVAAFDGRLSADDGVASAAEFAAQLFPGAEVVFDLRHLNGYHSAARAAWQEALWPHRHSLRSITLVGGNALVRMGGRLLGLALGVEVHASTADGYSDTSMS